MRKQLHNIYFYFVTLPDRLYPFACEIEGRLVRGRQSYERAVANAFETYGPGRFGYKLTLYRGAFHLVGSILFITLSAVLSKYFFGSDVALYVLLGTAICALLLQEFYLQPLSHQQRARKGATDVLTWVLPIMIYLVLFAG